MKHSFKAVGVLLFFCLGCFAIGQSLPEKPGDGPKDQAGPEITIGTDPIPGSISTGTGSTTTNPDGSITVTSITNNPDGSTTTTVITLNPDGTSTTTTTTTSTICTKNGMASYDIRYGTLTACFGSGQQCTYTGPCTGSN